MVAGGLWGGGVSVLFLDGIVFYADADCSYVINHHEDWEGGV